MLKCDRVTLDGVALTVPLTTWYNLPNDGPLPEAITCERCHARVAPAIIGTMDHGTLVLLDWNYCECMQRARTTLGAAGADDAARNQFIERQTRYDRWLPYWRQSPRAQRETFATWQHRSGTEKAWQSADEFAKQTPRRSSGLLLTGPTGTGKTHLLRAVTHALTLRAVPVLGADTRDWLARIKQTYGPSGTSETEDDLFRLVRGAPLVVVDDLGAERDTEWGRDRLLTLIESRYDAMRPILVSTNCDLDELADRVGARITSRLIEMCRIQAIAASDFRHTRHPGTWNPSGTEVARDDEA